MSTEQPSQQDYIRSDKDLLDVKECVHSLLYIADRYGGICYGGYVRDVLVRPELTSVCIKDVDIWFKTNEDRDSFVTHITSDGTLGFNIEETPFHDSSNRDTPKNTTSFGLSARNISVRKDGKHIIFIDAVSSKDFPVFDFTVNFLVYKYSRINGSFLVLNNLEGSSTPTLIEEAKTRTTRLTPKAEDVIRCREKMFRLNETTEIDCDRFRTRVASFMKRGWTILHSNGKQFERSPLSPLQPMVNGVLIPGPQGPIGARGEKGEKGDTVIVQAPHVAEIDAGGGMVIRLFTLDGLKITTDGSMITITGK